MKKRLNLILPSKLYKIRKEKINELMIITKKLLLNNSIHEAKNNYVKIVGEYSKLPLQEQIEINSGIKKLEESINDFETYKEKRQVIEIVKKLEKIDDKPEKKILKELTNDISKIKDYGLLITKKEKHLFQISRKNFLYQLNELKEKIESMESSEKLTQPQQTFIKKITNTLLKTKDYIQDYYTLEEEHITDSIKNIQEHINEMENKGIYSLTKKGKNFLKSLEDGSIFSNLTEIQLKFLDKTIQKYKIHNLFQDTEEKTHNFINEMQEAKMLKIKKSVRPAAFLINHDEIQKLNKEEEKIIGKIDKLKKSAPAENIDVIQTKKTRYLWETEANKIRKEVADENNLTEEETKLLTKINKI